LLMQLHGYQHAVAADEFAFNTDGHLHAHDDMRSTTTPSALDQYPRRLGAAGVP